MLIRVRGTISITSLKFSYLLISLDYILYYNLLDLKKNPSFVLNRSCWLCLFYNVLSLINKKLQTKVKRQDKKCTQLSRFFLKYEIVWVSFKSFANCLLPTINFPVHCYEIFLQTIQFGACFLRSINTTINSQILIV